jgi:hypothetical protein
LYFLAQHHGLPTRLLDWTSNPLAALFFAVTDSRSTEGEVIAIARDGVSHMKSDDSTQQRMFVLQHSHFQNERAPLIKNTIECLFDLRDENNLFEGLSEFYLPVARPIVIGIVPDTRTGRIFQQHSRFTLHMPGCEPISSDRACRWTVPANRKSSLLLELRMLGIRWDTLFPDLDHVAEEIREFENLRP